MTDTVIVHFLDGSKIEFNDITDIWAREKWLTLGNGKIKMTYIATLLKGVEVKQNDK